MAKTFDYLRYTTPTVNRYICQCRLRISGLSEYVGIIVSMSPSVSGAIAFIVSGTMMRTDV